MPELEPNAVENFRGRIIDSGYVLDTEGTHHEFVSGMHGQKLDFDNIEDGSPLYAEWVQVTAGYIEEEFPDLPAVIVGVANGTNRVALDTARKFDGDVFGAVSKKREEDSKKLYLPENTSKLIAALQPELVVVKEDVGTTGSNSVQVAKACLEAGAQDVEVVITWKRRQALERLEEAGIAYRAMIDEPLTTYTPEECERAGFCADDWDFIPRDK